MSENDVEVRFGGDVGEATSAITALREVLQGLESPIRGIRNNLGELAEAFVAAFAIEKISEFVEHIAELGEKTERAAAILGVSTEQVGRLNAIAALTGTSTEGMSFAMERLQLSLAHAKDASTPAAASLRALGLSANDLIKLPLDQQMAKLADRFAEFANGGGKTAVAMTLLGRAGAQMIPALNEGAEGMQKLGDMGQRTGTILSSETVETLGNLHSSIVEFGQSLLGVGVTLVTAFAPALKSIVDSLTDLIQWFNNTVKEGGLFKGLLDLLSEAAKGLATALLTVVMAIEVLAQTAIFALQELRDAASLSLSAMKQDFATWQNSVTDSAHQWVKRMNELWGELGKAGGEGNKPKLDLNLSSGKEISAAMAAIDGQIKVLQQGLAQKTVLLNAEAAQFQITEDHKYAELIAAHEREYQAEAALLQKKLALSTLDVKQHQTVLNQIEVSEERHRTQMMQLDAQSIAARQKLYEQFGNALTSSFNGQLRGLLAGTTSWSQAFKSILGDMIIYFIEQIEKMVVQWAAGQLAQTTASQSGALARAAADATATEATLPLRAGKFISDITADAAAVFAGVFANMAPLLGPAAAGPAGAAQASVLAVGLPAVPKLAVGTPYVLNDGLAMLHKGEAVVPAQVNGPWQNGGHGGGTQVVYSPNIYALDGPSVTRVVRQHANLIRTILNGSAALNPSTA